MVSEPPPPQLCIVSPAPSPVRCSLLRALLQSHPLKIPAARTPRPCPASVPSLLGLPAPWDQNLSCSSFWVWNPCLFLLKERRAEAGCLSGCVRCQARRQEETAAPAGGGDGPRQARGTLGGWLEKCKGHAGLCSIDRPHAYLFIRGWKIKVSPSTENSLCQTLKGRLLLKIM